MQLDCPGVVRSLNAPRQRQRQRGRRQRPTLQGCRIAHPVLTGTGCRGGALTGEPPNRVGGRKCPGLAFEEPAEHKDYPRKKSNVMLVLCADMLAVVAHWAFCGFSPLNFFKISFDF